MKTLAWITASTIAACVAVLLWLALAGRSAKESAPQPSLTSARSQDRPPLDAVVTGESRDAEPREPIHSAESEPAHGEKLVIVCLDEGGRPLPQAQVHLVASTLADWTRLRDGWQDAWMSRAEIVQRGELHVADARGRVEVEKSRAFDIVLATAGDLSLRLNLGSDAISPSVLHLLPDRSLRVRVRNRAGLPVAGVGLELVDADGYLRWRGHADEAGNAAIPCERDVQAHLVAESAEWPPPACLVDVGRPPSEPVDLVVDGDAFIDLRIVDGHGRTIHVNGQVRVRFPLRESRDRPGDEPKLTFVPLQDGRAGIRCRAGARNVPVAPELDDGTRLGEQWVDAPEIPGARRDVPWEIDDARMLEGTAEDEGGRPLASRVIDWSVSSENADGSSRPLSQRGYFMTDENGRFRGHLEEPFPAGVPLHMRLGTFAAEVRCAAELDLAPGELAGSRLPLVRFFPVAALVKGCVVDESGNPVAMALVRDNPITNDRSGQEEDFGFGTCDALGRFVLHARDDVVRARLSVQIGDEYPEVEEPIRVLRRGEDITVRVHRQGSIEGRMLLDPDAVADLWIGARRAEDERAFELSTQWGDGAGRRFRLRNLPPGTWTLEIGRNSEQTVVARVEDVVVRSGEPAQDARLWPLDLRGKLGPGFRERTLLVSDEHGQAIHQGLAWFRIGSDLAGPHAWTGGSVRIPAWAEGVAVWSSGSCVRRGDLPEDGATWRLEPAIEVRVEMSVPENHRHPGLRCWLEVGEPDDDALPSGIMRDGIYVQLQDDGAFHLQLPGPGRYRSDVSVSWEDAEGTHGVDPLDSPVLEIPAGRSRTTIPLRIEPKTWDDSLDPH